MPKLSFIEPLIEPREFGSCISIPDRKMRGMRFIGRLLQKLGNLACSSSPASVNTTVVGGSVARHGQLSDLLFYISVSLALFARLST